MTGLWKGNRLNLLRLSQAALAGILVVGVAGFGAPGPGVAAVDDVTVAQSVPSGGQEFEDVPPTNPFYAFINNLYVDAVISGYACGGVGEPCVPPLNRPYYRPNADVTRGQMSKFVENGRRNIDVAVGERLTLTSPGPALVISTTTADGMRVQTAAGADGVDTDCTRANVNCYALEASSVTG